ncbi:MAG TPA: DUF362 domain-containing protein [Negativicutes bacterium]
MSVMGNALVAIVNCTRYHNYPDVKKSVEEVIDFLGGIESIVSLGDHVLIKPNLVWPVPYTSGAITNPYVVKAIAELCLKAGATKIIIADSAAVGCKASEIFEKCDYKRIIDNDRYEFIDFTDGNYQYIVNPSALIFKKIRLPQAYLEANVVINVPVMKTHDALGLTLGLKNMKGIIHLSDKKRFHKWGLAQSIVDLNKVALPELTIMDGTVAMEGNGPVAGEPVGLGLVMASTDTVACDRVAAEIMGFNEEEIDYIKMAAEQGLGCFDLAKIKVIGKNIADVKRPFQRLLLNTAKLNELGINILACNACSGCSNVVISYLKWREKSNNLDLLKGTTIIYGQNAYLSENISGKIISVGTCTRSLTGEEITYIPGCPPHPAHLDEKLL